MRNTRSVLFFKPDPKECSLPAIATKQGGSKGGPGTRALGEGLQSSRQSSQAWQMDKLQELLEIEGKEVEEGRGGGLKASKVGSRGEDRSKVAMLSKRCDSLRDSFNKYLIRRDGGPGNVLKLPKGVYQQVTPYNDYYFSKFEEMFDYGHNYLLREKWGDGCDSEEQTKSEVGYNAIPAPTEPMHMMRTDERAELVRIISSVSLEDSQPAPGRRPSPQSGKRKQGLATVAPKMTIDVDTRAAKELKIKMREKHKGRLDSHRAHNKAAAVSLHPRRGAQQRLNQGLDQPQAKAAGASGEQDTPPQMQRRAQDDASEYILSIQ